MGIFGRDDDDDRDERTRDPEDQSQIAKDPTDPATNAALTEGKAGVEEDWEGLTREETAEQNKDAVEALKPKDDDTTRITAPSVPAPPFIDPTSVSPVDPDSDPGQRKAAREAGEGQTVRTGPLDPHGNVVPEDRDDDDDDLDDEEDNPNDRQV